MVKEVSFGWDDDTPIQPELSRRAWDLDDPYDVDGLTIDEPPRVSRPRKQRTKNSPRTDSKPHDS